MKIHLVQSIQIFICAICLSIGLVKAQDINTDIYGNWRIARDMTPEGSITSKSARQVHAAIGKVAQIRSDRFVFNGNDCRSPEYARSVDDTLQYFRREWKIDATSLPLGPKVTIVDAGCAFHMIYPIDAQRLIIANDGVFYEAVRVRKPVSSASR